MSAADFEKYEELEHTADVGLRIRGRTFEELCENAARGTFSLIGEATFSPDELSTRRIEFACADVADCLYEWLRAALLAFAVDGFFMTKVHVDVAEGTLVGTLEGGRFDVGRHVFFTELKAVTRHGLRVEQTRDGFEAEVIFDV